LIAELGGDLDDRVLLASNQLPRTALKQNLTRVDVEPLRRPLGVKKKAGVNAGVAERQCRTVDDLWPWHDRPDRLVRGGGQLEPIEPADVNSLASEHRGNDFNWRIPGSRAQSAAAAIDICRALVDCREAIGYCAAQVVYSAFFEFESGVTALATFNGYGNFDTMELTWNRGEGGGVRPDDQMETTRPRSTGPMPIEEFYDLPENDLDRMLARGHGTGSNVTQANFFGFMVVSCERGDMRQHPEGLYLYTERGRELVPVPAAPGAEVREMVAAITERRPTFPDHNWGRASLECCIGMIESSRQRKELEFEYQSPSPVRMPEPLKRGGSPDRYAHNIWR